MAKKKNKITKEQEDKIVSTIVDRMGARVKLLYNLMQAADVLMNDILNGFQNYGTCFSRERKQNYNHCMDAIRTADHYYSQFAEEDLAASAVASGGYSKLDSYRKDANELVRFVMLYIDRSRTNEAYQKIGSMLDSLPEGGVFPADVIAHFNFK